MDWIATNIRFPKDQYMKLKQKASEERKSLAAVVRKAAQSIEPLDNQEERKRKAEKFIKEVEKVAKANARYTKGFDSVKALREIRYQAR